LIFKKLAGQSPKGKTLDGDVGVKVLINNDRLETAFLRISSAISAHDDLPATLEIIAREALICLNAQRSTIFLVERKSGILKRQCTYAPNPLYEDVGLLEEEEMARKAFGLLRPFLLQEPKDFSDFFKYEEGGLRLTSLLCIPLSSRGKPIGALSVVLIKEGRSFAEKDLQFLSLFSNHASIAIENAHLQEELRMRINFRRSYQKYLDDTLNQLQNLPEEERGRIEEHIQRLLPGQKGGEKKSLEPQAREEVKGLGEDLSSSGKSGTDREKDDRAEEMSRMQFEDESLGLADQLIPGGVFIQTPNPKELGEQLILKFNMSDGKEPIEVACKVVWTNKYGIENNDSRRGMVVKFLNLEQETQKKIKEYIRSRNNFDETNFV
jgi:Tfp pilus assembly protein PilZ